mgnify:CR=1 FL=1
MTSERGELSESCIWRWSEETGEKKESEEKEVRKRRWGRRASGVRLTFVTENLSCWLDVWTQPIWQISPTDQRRKETAHMCLCVCVFVCVWCVCVCNTQGDNQPFQWLVFIRIMFGFVSRSHDLPTRSTENVHVHIHSNASLLFTLRWRQQSLTHQSCNTINLQRSRFSLKCCRIRLD